MTTESSSDDARQAALSKLDGLLHLLRSAPDQAALAPFISEGEALRVSIASFHIEGIRFRAFTLEKRLAATSAVPASALDLFTEVKHALEAAGFSSKSH